ncbi:MAG: tRNA 2-thiouridine(34) synthase MnmA [Nanoarchaeota archaeon]
MKTKNNPQKKVLLAMSGGVDSSVAALLLKKQGYRVIGAFIKSFTEKSRGGCAWRDEKRAAQQIAAKLKIPLITLDFEKEYKKQIIEPMFKSYAKGKTPNPDILCNKIIKFPLLWKAAQELKIHLIATGHYARIKKTPEGFQLLTGLDSKKDQSYFLAELTQFDLSHTLFPLGSHTKLYARQIAKSNNFSNWNKQSTRGICFVGKTDMPSFLKQKIKEKPGKILSPEGKVIGRHPGIAYFTIGQKLGEHLGIIINKPSKLAQKRFYIAKRKNNILIAAPEGHLALKNKEIILKHLHLVNPKKSLPKLNLKVCIRYRGQLHAGKLKKINKKYKFTFKKPVTAIAEGQYLVIYKGKQLIGCGEILSSR